MDPRAAADLLADLSQETSEEILEEMEPEERESEEELLEHAENTAAGRMTTYFLSFRPQATAVDAIQALYTSEGSRETLSTLHLIAEPNKWVGPVPLLSAPIAPPPTR